jgi:hypothetical protein
LTVWESAYMLPSSWRNLWVLLPWAAYTHPFKLRSAPQLHPCMKAYPACLLPGRAELPEQKGASSSQELQGKIAVSTEQKLQAKVPFNPGHTLPVNPNRWFALSFLAGVWKIEPITFFYWIRVPGARRSPAAQGSFASSTAPITCRPGI